MPVCLPKPDGMKPDVSRTAVAAALVLAGFAMGIWSFRRSRIPLMLGAWLCGVGLACLLRSPSLLGLAGLAVAGGMFRVDPGRLARLGGSMANCLSRTPRWLTLGLAAAASQAALPALTMDRATPAATAPAILVQIRCKPGTADLWRASFNRHIRPAIDEVVARGDSFTGFQLIEPVLPWQHFDFVLLYTGRTFAGLDQPRLFPHYLALLEREGPLRSLSAAKELGSYEDQVSVTLVHVSRTR
jgi:hypothetical protein